MHWDELTLQIYIARWRKGEDWGRETHGGTGGSWWWLHEGIQKSPNGRNEKNIQGGYLTKTMVQWTYRVILNQPIQFTILGSQFIWVFNVYLMLMTLIFAPLWDTFCEDINLSDPFKLEPKSLISSLSSIQFKSLTSRWFILLEKPRRQLLIQMHKLRSSAPD